MQECEKQTSDYVLMQMLLNFHVLYWIRHD